MHRLKISFVSLTFILILMGCRGPVKENQLSDTEKQAGWQLLFDGSSLNGWHCYNEGKIESGWEATDGELKRGAKNKLQHSDLVTDSEFENFELTFEWKIGTAGNSGVFIDVVERPDLKADFMSGPEYQLLDTAHHDFPIANKRSGCVFGFSPPLNTVSNKPSDEWNQSVIKQTDGKLEFYLNGVLTAKEDLRSPAWMEKINQGNFKKYPEFGRQTKGHISLQDWEKGVSFRNLKIRVIQG